MKYLGSKRRHAKEILAAIWNEIDAKVVPKRIRYIKLPKGKSFKSESSSTQIIYSNPESVHYQNWVEPFVGGANMIDKVPKSFGLILGADINPFVISMFNALQQGWIPPESISESEYNRLKKASEHYDRNEAPLIGFVGITCSYSGKWFGGYATGDNRNFAREAKDHLLKQVKKLNGITFVYSDYQDLTIPETHSIIYCDPPYHSTTDYRDSIKHRKFWDWCNRQIENGHKVFVSEYKAPKDWRCIWQKQVNISVTKENYKNGIEKLFAK
jgi:DNA adenine methylase